MGSPLGLSTTWNITTTVMMGASSAKPKAGARFVDKHSAPTNSMVFNKGQDDSWHGLKPEIFYNVYFAV
jgi:hypothetical protein